MVTTPVELATASKPSLGMNGACGICSRYIWILSELNLALMPLITSYLCIRVGGLPAPGRTPFQMPDEAFVLGQTVGQSGLGTWTAHGRPNPEGPFINCARFPLRIFYFHRYLVLNVRLPTSHS